jgi:hypothetical protein
LLDSRPASVKRVFNAEPAVKAMPQRSQPLLIGALGIYLEEP